MGQPERSDRQNESTDPGSADSGASMEEILASIRRIIASDSPVETEALHHRENSGEAHEKPSGSGDPEKESPPVYQSPEMAPISDKPADAPAGSLSSLAASVRSARGAENDDEPLKSSADNRSESKATAHSSSAGGLAAIAASLRGEKSGEAIRDQSAESSDIPTRTTLGPVAEDQDGQDGNPAPQKSSAGGRVSLGEIAAMASSQESAAPPAERPVTTASGPLQNSAMPAAKTETTSLENIAAETTAAAAGFPQRTELERATDNKPADAAETRPDSLAATKSVDADTQEETVSRFREALVAPSTREAVSGSMNRLQKAASDVSAAQVEAVLRPMLKQWLDENLPDLVEKMVQAEIDRISGGGAA